MWAAAQGALEDVLLDDSPPAAPRAQRDRLQVFQGLATFYLRYLQIFRSLEGVYDQIVHPQKRRVVRHVLDGVMGRLLELKNEMVELDFSEFHYLDDVLQDLKLTPEDLEVPIPRYFVRERIRVLQDRERMLAHVLTKGGHLDQEPEIQTMCVEEAVRVLQVCERARQGRLRARFMKEIRQAEERRDQEEEGPPARALDPGQAATHIQKVWRGYSARKQTQRVRLEEMIFLGMVPPEQQPQARPSAVQLRARKVEASRRLVQEANEAEYQRALVDAKASVLAVEGPDIRETLREQIRQWFLECRDATGKFPDLPSAEDGGSASIFARKTPEQVAAELAAREEERERKRKSKGKREKKEKKEDRKGRGQGKKGRDDTEEEKGWTMPPSNFLPAVVEGAKMYKDVWQGRDERLNFTQRFDAQLVHEEKRLEVEEEVRVQVDELMRQELKSLKMTVDRERGGRRKNKGKKGNKKKKKKGKKGGKKKKKEKDLTADRTLESLYEELVLEGFLIRPMNIKLSEYIGDYSYLGSALRQAHIEPMPSLTDVRQLLTLYGILPLGSQSVHERAPVVKALLLAGPSGVGKKMLVHAVCTETGANLFNLSPGALAGKYPGRGGLQYLLHAVFKVARQMQPSVIWIGDTEKTFYKKVPKTDKERNDIDTKRESILRALVIYLHEDPETSSKEYKDSTSDLAEEDIPVMGIYITWRDGAVEPEDMGFVVEGGKVMRNTEPKRLRKDLCKALKSLKPEERILVVGTTRRPFDADLKSLCKVYRKIILIPRPDYASRLVLWRALLQGGGAQLGPGLDLSSLAKVTDGYTQGHIARAVRAVLTPRRLARQGARSLSAAEFIPPLARQDPVYREEEEAFKAWYSRTPLAKRRARAAKAEEEEGRTGGAGGRRDGKDRGQKPKDLKSKKSKKNRK